LLCRSAADMEPSFRCQSCKARLVLVRGSNDGVQDRRSDQGLLAALDNSKIDPAESFIVLDDRRGPGAYIRATMKLLIVFLTASKQPRVARFPAIICCCTCKPQESYCILYA
jgi:hypothetical protein